MAEGGFLGEVLGGEVEAEAAEAAESRGGAEAFAAALAADEAKHDPAVARAAEAFLKRQARLLELQAEELLEQLPLRMAQLRGQTREGRLRRAGQRLRLGIQVFTALILTALGLGVAVMVYDAFASRAVVVDPFKAPPALAGRGLTGDVVAEDVLDALHKMQATTRTTRKGLQTEGAWASDVKIEVPETGVSLGEFGRLLRARFGHDLHIDGDLVITDTGGLALTVRGDGVPAQTFQGGMGDLEKLTVQAAEHVYGRSEPFRYQNYLSTSGRYTDVLAFMPGAFARAKSDAERADLANGWAIAYAALDQPAAAVAKYRMAMKLAPRLSDVWWKAWGNLIGAEAGLPGGEEAAWRESQDFEQAMRQAPKDRQPQRRFMSNIAIETWDLPMLLASGLAEAANNGGAGAAGALAAPTVADAYGAMHDYGDAARYMAGADPADTVTQAEADLLQAYQAFDRGAPAAATTVLEHFWKLWQGDPNVQYTFTDNPCLLGYAYGNAGRRADAEAVFARVGSLSRCAAFHGLALARSGDVARAERVWSDNLKLTPDLPMVYLERGLWETERGQFAAAAADLSTAHAKAPHYAEPLKAWGDLLARQGRWRDALGKYDEALKSAPAWIELRQARALAARSA